MRPEHIKVGEEGGLKAEVEVVEPLGLSTQFYARLGGQDVCVFAMGRPTVKPGNSVTLSAQPSAIHLFGANGARIG